MESVMEWGRDTFQIEGLRRLLVQMTKSKSGINEI